MTNSNKVGTYLWLQLDENLYDLKSRGQAKTPATARSRYGDANTTFKGGYNITSVKLMQGNNSVNAENIISDTRMQIRLSNPLAANGGTIKFKIEYNYLIPQYGSDRTGILSTKKRKYLCNSAMVSTHVCV